MGSDYDAIRGKLEGINDQVKRVADTFVDFQKDNHETHKELFKAINKITNELSAFRLPCETHKSEGQCSPLKEIKTVKEDISNLRVIIEKVKGKVFVHRVALLIISAFFTLVLCPIFVWYVTHDIKERRPVNEVSHTASSKETIWRLQKRSN